MCVYVCVCICAYVCVCIYVCICLWWYRGKAGRKFRRPQSCSELLFYQFNVPPFLLNQNPEQLHVICWRQANKYFRYFYSPTRERELENHEQPDVICWRHSKEIITRERDLERFYHSVTYPPTLWIQRPRCTEYRKLSSNLNQTVYNCLWNAYKYGNIDNNILTWHKHNTACRLIRLLEVVMWTFQQGRQQHVHRMTQLTHSLQTRSGYVNPSTRCNTEASTRNR